MLFVCLFCGVHLPAWGALQFDVFLGYDGIVPEASWFPVTCEVHNDGPSFNAYFEISSGKFGSTQVRRVPIELPTNTRKRVVVPVFSSSRYSSWNFRLIDDRENIHAQQMNIRPRHQTAWGTRLLGALPRSVAGVPALPDIKSGQPEMQPLIARLQPALFPDNPIALEGLDALYLSSEAALELKVPQRDALLTWLNAGGHLVVSVEQLSDVSGDWLSSLLPCELTGTKMIKPNSAFQKWLQLGVAKAASAELTNAPAKTSFKNKNISNVNPFSELNPDERFEQKEMLVFTGKLRDGAVLISSEETPLMVTTQRGRGHLTLLNFSAEREPFLSWKNRAWFWSKLADVPANLYQSSDYNSYGGSSIDGVFGAMIDSKQVRKLPFAWLLFLLVLYLAVIGPLDRFWLKKINRQMLTWLTFPAYVVGFSALIYFIGFKLRAGDSEFNELHVVDIFPHNDKAVLRGRTYASIYSPSNARYTLVGEQSFSALRGEFNYSYGGADDGSDAVILQDGNNFSAQIPVPVWTSRLCVSDWLQPSDLPLKVAVRSEGDGWSLAVENLLDHKLSEARVVIDRRVYFVGDLSAKQQRTLHLDPNQGVALKEFVRQHGAGFYQAIQLRRANFGDQQATFNVALGSMAASFGSKLDEANSHQFFISPEGLDLSLTAEQGDIIFLAWDAGQLLTKPLNKFTTRRSQRDTLLRFVVPK